MLRYAPKKRLDINQLSKHKFITNDVKKFRKIDKDIIDFIFILEKENPCESSKVIKKWTK